MNVSLPIVMALLGSVVSAGVQYVTEAPTSANTNGLGFVVLDTEPDTKYDGWVYLIVGD